MAGRHLQRPQHGAALLVFLVLLVMGALTWIVSNLTPEIATAHRDHKTSEALAQARDALIGYALNYRDTQAAKDADSNGADDRAMYGYLPLPDLGSSRNQNIDPACLDAGGNPLEGCDANFFTGLTFDANGIGPTVVGRFPWRTLGTGPLRDGHGECLWLVVSSLHGRIQRAAPPPVLPSMNWDTLGQLDIVVANGTNALNSALASVHERPIAIIYAPGPPLPGQDRSPSASDDVTQCGGNYNAANYLDPATATALGGITNYLAGTNAASGNTGDSNPANDPDVPKPFLSEGKVFASGGNYLPNACSGANCELLANDTGLRLTADHLFAALRKNANFRTDINSMLDRMVDCLRDEIANGGSVTNGKIAGANNNTCYGEDVHPLGYYPHWREMVFVAVPATVNGTPCAGALLFGGQRASSQTRVTIADKGTAANYLEGTNLSEFTAGTHNFTGPVWFDRAGSGQTASQDIVRCIPFGGSLTSVTSPALNPLGGQIVDYDPGTRTLTLGRIFTITSAQRTANAGAFFGCSWTPEPHLLGTGLRSYFKFRILDTGEGYTFAIIDGDRNGANVCGAANQHLGYSDNNGITPSIAYPKIGIEIDTARQATRADPSYTGGHLGIVYWGSEATENDDNIHGQPTTPAVARPAPQNPVAPASPTPGAGVYKLDPSLSSIPVNQDIHVRVELTRTATDNTNRSNSYLLEVWLLKQSVTDANRIAAMKNTTRPMAQLYPGFTAHLQDTPTIYDLQGGACTSDTDCLAGQTCSSTDNRCYAPAFRTARLGFTTSQSTAARDQIISITDLFTTWLP